MSPSSVCAATEQPPPHTGMNEQSPHSSLCARQALEALGRGARATRRRGRSMWPVDSRGLAGEAGAGVERAVGADACRRGGDGSRTDPCARRRASGSRACASRRAGTTSSRRRSGTMSHGARADVAPPPAPALVMHVPPSGLSLRADDGQRDDPLRLLAARGALMIGLKLILRDLVGELLLAQEVEQRRIAVPPTTRRSCRRW